MGNTAARVAAARVLELAGLGTVVPSLLYFERDRPFSAGAEAREDYAKALERWRAWCLDRTATPLPGTGPP